MAIRRLWGVVLALTCGCGTTGGGWAVPGVGDYLLAWSPEGERLACTPASTNPERDERLRVVAPAGERVPVAFDPAGRRVHALRFSGPDELLALTSDGTGATLERFDPTRGTPLATPLRLPAPEGTFLREAASSDGVRWVLVWEHALTCVEVAGGEARLVWERPRGEDEFPSALTISPDGRRAAVAISRLTSDGSGVVVHAPWIELLGLERGETEVLLGPLVSQAPVASGPGPHPVLCLGALAFSGDGALLASGEEGGWIRLWDLAAGAEAGGVMVQRGPTVTDLAFAAGGLLAAGSSDKTISLFALSEGSHFGPPGSPVRLGAEELWRDDPPGGADGFRTRVAFSPDGRQIARAVAMYSPWEEEDGERQLRVYEARSGDPLE